MPVDVHSVLRMGEKKILCHGIVVCDFSLTPKNGAMPYSLVKYACEVLKALVVWSCNSAATLFVRTTTRPCRWSEKALVMSKTKTPLEGRITCGLATARDTKRRTFRMNDNKSLAHTTWNCKYHIVFAPKYRRKIFYGEKRAEIGKILRELCGWKGVTIIEAEVCPDHIHMLVEIPPKMSVSSFMGFLKGKSSLLIHERHANLKYKHGNRSFGAGVTR